MYNMLGGIVRARTGSLFSYYGYNRETWAYQGSKRTTTYDGYYTNAWASRSVIVVGEGL